MFKIFFDFCFGPVFFGDRLIRQKGTKNFVKDCFCFLRVGGAVGNKDNEM